MSPARSPKIAVLGSINMDLVVRCDRLPTPGQTILADSSDEFCGGKGANQAVAASLAGGSVSMIGAVGSDAFASRLIDNLKRHDVNTDAVLRREKLASGLAVIAVDASGQNSIMVVSGANASVSREDVIAARSVIESCDVLLVQLEIPIQAVLAGIEIAKQSGKRVIVDPAPAIKQAPRELFQADLICPNETEASALTGVCVESIEDAIVAAKRLQTMGAEQVAITLGERGTLLLRDGESKLIPAFKIKAVDTTAAGDAFAGALAVDWSRKNDLIESIHFANAAGALAASVSGAQASMAGEAEIMNLRRSQQ